MSLLGRERFRSLVLRYVELPAALTLKALGFTPNAVTLLGFAITVGAAVLVARGCLLAGGLVFLAGSLFDCLDGALARATKQVSRFGALLDSVMDRLGEAVLFLGLAIFALRELESARLMLVIVSLITALALSQAVSYARARGEGLGIDARVGLLTRPERVIILVVFVAAGLPEVAFIAIASLSLVTLLQRLLYIRRYLGGG